MNAEARPARAQARRPAAKRAPAGAPWRTGVRDRPAADGAAGSWARPIRARTAPFTRSCRRPRRVGRRVGRALHSSHAHRDVPCRASAKNAKLRKDSLVRHFLNPDYCGSVRADGVYTHYRRRHDPLLHGTNSRALRVDRLDRTINSYTCPARGGLEAPAYKRLTRQ